MVKRKLLLGSHSGTNTRSEVTTADGTYSGDRRTFIKRMGVTLGAISTGTSALSGPVAASGSAVSDDDVVIETVDVSRPKRNQIVRKTRNTDEFEDLATVLDVSKNASSVIEYRVEIKGEVRQGHRVTFGEQPNGTAAVGAGSSFINVHLSESFESGARTTGKEEIDGGIRWTSSDQNGIFDLGTQRATDVARAIIGKNNVSAASVNREQINVNDAVLGYSERNVEAGGVLILPVEETGEIVDRLVVQLSEPFSDPTVESATVPDDVGTMGHVVCGPFGVVCTNYCTVLCGTLAGVSAAGCAAACASTVGGLPITVGCGSVCAAVVHGTCYNVCKSEAH